MAKAPVNHLGLKRYLTYWTAVAVGYIFPFIYFIVTAGIKRQATKMIMPTLIAGIFLVLKLSTDTKKWVKTWRPSLSKGLILATPKIILFGVLITMGLYMKHILEQQIVLAFYSYFEAVFVLFGGQAVGSIISAFHLKYRQLHMMEHGYVLGVVNNG